MDQKYRSLQAWLLPVMAVLGVLLVLQLVYSRRQTGFEELKPRDGVLDLRAVDVQHRVVTVANDWAFYPDVLLTAEDFEKGREYGQEESTAGHPYGTHRLEILGPANAYYAICGYSVDYCSRIYVDGQELYTSGLVSEDPAVSVPKTGYLTVPIALGADGRAEIICQYSNFVHTDGGYIHATYLSTPQNIEDYKTGNTVVSATLGGGLLLLALYFFLLAAFQRQGSYLLLALCCLLFSMRDQLYFFVSLLPRALPWQIEYRIYIGEIALLPVALLLLLEDTFPRGKAWPRRTFLGYTAVVLILTWVLPTKALRFLNIGAYFCDIPYLICRMVQTALYFREKKKPDPWDLASLAGFGILFVSLILEGILSFHNAAVVRYGLTPSAMLIFLFLVALGISLRIQAGERALAQSRSRSEMLASLNEMNLDFLHTVAHELKTPLTVISGYAQLTGLQLSGDRIDEETPENLKTIHQEAMRLAELVTRLMEYSYGSHQDQPFSQVPVQPLLEKAKAICGPICLKNQNHVKLQSLDAVVYGSPELLLQIFVNLAVNANRHTKNGRITFSAQDGQDPRMLEFRVTDTGTGIAGEDLPRIFQKGWSGDGSSGLGLSICAEAVKAQKGRIWVEQTGKSGTVFAFTIPRTEE